MQTTPNIYYEIKDDSVISIPYSEVLHKKGLNLSNLYIDVFDEDNYLIINTFKNKTLIINKAILKESIPDNLYSDLETPTIDQHNLQTFIRIVNDTTVNPNKEVTFILAITYKCNLHCTYCYQQHDKTLKKTILDINKLEDIFNIILRYKKEHTDSLINIGLFGGEPLLIETSDIIDRVLNFCKENLFRLHITTNGTNLDFYIKKLIIRRKLIASINTTIDSIDLNSFTRKNLDTSLDGKKNSAYHILAQVKLLLQYNVTVDIATNVDAHSINNIKAIKDFFLSQGLFRYPHFRWDIGRVDDRLYETNYKYIISDVKILQKLIELHPMPNNIHAAFLKTLTPLCKNIHINFNKTELKGTHNYCWNSSTEDIVFYIDNDLDVFRCTYTVGRKKFALFNLSYHNIKTFIPKNRTFLDYECCIQCKIGGYCSGGCALSFLTNRDAQCTYEIANFNLFVSEIYKPHIKSLLKRTTYYE